MQAYSANNDLTPRYGFVKLNADPVWQGSWQGTHPNLRGVNVILVHPFKCSVQESRRFDTFIDAQAATDLSNYLLQASSYYIIVGVTADEPTFRLSNALPTLREMGADVADVQYRGSFGFVAQRGFPAKTVLRKVFTQADSNENPAHFNAIVTGAIDYRKQMPHIRRVYYVQYKFLHCLRKNVTNSSCCNFDIQESISTIFGRNITETISNQKMLYFTPHLTSASALPGETGNPEFAVFSLKCCMLFCQQTH